MLDIALRHDFGVFKLDAAFAAPAGVTCLFGRSGAGKTSVVRAVAGLLKADDARIMVGGARLDGLPVHRRGIGYVFQEPRLFPHMDVRGNLGYARTGVNPGPVVEMLGIGHLLDRRPAALSGGEAQRVAIGRALLSQPRLLLLDEPLAALDDARKAEILPYLERVRDAAEVPVLYVSHSVAEVARLATTLVALENGKVVRAGPAAKLLSDPDIAPIIGIREAGALVTARVVRHHDDGLTELTCSGGVLWLPHLSAREGAEVRVRIEAQDVMLAATRPQDISALNVLPVRVSALREGQGPGVMVQLAAGGDHLLARITHRSARAMGLSEGWQGYAVLKSVAVASGNIGH
jgi:molybdate transport system ATP-binding protein